jgi:hypothetical protein
VADSGAQAAAIKGEVTRMRTSTLMDCTGYRLVTRDETVGNVVAVVPSKGDDAIGVLVFHSGASCGLTALPFDEVEGVDVHGRRVVVKTNRTR